MSYKEEAINKPVKMMLCASIGFLYKYAKIIKCLTFLVLTALGLWAGYSAFSLEPASKWFFIFSGFIIVFHLLIEVVEFVFGKSIIEDYKKTIEKKDDEIRQIKKRYKDMLFDERSQALEECIQEISKKLKFSMQERICIYTHNEIDNSFDCRSRFSIHSELNKSYARKKYSGNDGVIGHVWHRGSHQGSLRDKNFPDFKIDEIGYKKYLLGTYNISTEISNNLRMKSVDLYAEIIRDTKQQPVAVIIFESERKNFINEEKIKSQMKNIKDRIIELLGKMHD